MREELKHRVGRRGAFTAMFSRTGVRKSTWSVDVTVLLLDVRDEAGQLVADHLWFRRGSQIERLQLKAGDRIRFMATVGPYSKRNRDGDADEDRYVVDYKLIYPSNMRLIGMEPQHGLPLFDEQLPLASSQCPEEQG
jgi:hypothetical protein